MSSPVGAQCASHCAWTCCLAAFKENTLRNLVILLLTEGGSNGVSLFGKGAKVPQFSLVLAALFLIVGSLNTAHGPVPQTL